MTDTTPPRDEDFFLADILAKTDVIAVVGASDNWKRPVYFVMKYLLKQGYDIVPVNPRYAGREILGRTCYADLADIPFAVDMVDVFRRGEDAPDIAAQAVAIGAKTLWLQIGVISDEARTLAEGAGLNVIMDRCPKIEHSRLSGLLGMGGFYSGLLSARRGAVRPPPAPARDGGFVKSQNIETLAVHAGTRPDPATGARITPLYQTTAFTFDDADQAASLYNLQEPGNIYGRLSNPTTAALEQRLAALDGGLGAVCVASGHAAQLVALYPLMQPGKKVVASRQLYGGTITQLTTTFARFGWSAELVDIHDLDAVRAAVAAPDVAVLFAESLANPDGNVPDLAALADIAHDAGLPLVIDNTMATPVMCRPGDFGADLIVYSTTKFLSGHGMAMGGAVVDTGRFNWFSGRDYPALTSPDPAYHGITFAETFGPLGYITCLHASVLRDLGPTMAPFHALLTLTGLETLPLRMRQHNENAEKIARFLIRHDKVAAVSWAGFSDSPYHHNAQTYLTGGAGSVFTLTLTGGFEAGQTLVENCNLFSHLANIGDARSLIIHPASTTHRQLTADQRMAAGVGDAVVRLSVGIEHSADLIADLAAALDRCPA